MPRISNLLIRILFMSGIVLTVMSCTSPEETKVTLFEKISSGQSGVTFENALSPTEEFNMYVYRNFYNGGGVALGDISGNGLPDIFLTGNMVSNRLYVNEGNFQFRDITEEAGLLSDGTWSTGVSMVDINGNGLLDIFVTKSGPPDGENRHNQLFINNGDLTFTDKSEEYGLDEIGLSTHAVFFDYNGNGRMDMYLVSNSFRSLSSFGAVTGKERTKPDPEGASKLYRNEGGYFTDVTQEAGIYSSIIGFGLSATVADINKNGWPDLYIANDFFERDYLYINNGDGTFTESLEKRMRSISHSSMGSDIADLNNDGWPDIYVSDMLPFEERRLKSKMTIDSWENYRDKVDRGFHHKYTRNTLQANRGDEEFMEIGRYAGVEATDWSWAVLLADLDHNGFNDIFVTNGIYKDLLDQDYIQYVARPDLIRERILAGEEDVIMNLMEEMSSEPIRNFAFSNGGDFQFSDRTSEWGLDEPGFSSGAAWADLNGDGALDLVVNNVNGPAWIYRNRTSELFPERNWLRIDLKGERPNTQAIGAQVQIWSGDHYWYREHILQRGFQSSVEPGIHVGFGEDVDRVDSLVVRWPDGRTSSLYDLEVPAKLEIDQSAAVDNPAPPPHDAQLPGALSISENELNPLLEDITTEMGLGWRHIGYDYSDFDREGLLVRMRSTEGPALCVGDVNGNGLDDFYIGGARDQPGVLFVQNNRGEFTRNQSELFEQDSRSEDIDCAFFDATGNGADELYVASGGNSYSPNSSALRDRLYLNDGHGKLTRSDQILPSARRFESTSVVTPADFTDDGNIDLFVGARLRLFGVGLPANGYLLAGDGQGSFQDVTNEWAPEMNEAGMITDAVWTDLLDNGYPDLVLVGEWMPVRVFTNDGERLTEATGKFGLSETKGWWNSIHAADINGNGFPDLIAGNHGLNSMFKADYEHPLKMWVADFEGNGRIEQILTSNKNGKDFPIALRHELLQEIPSLRSKLPDYASYAGQTVQDIFGTDQLSDAHKLQATTMESMVFWNTGQQTFRPQPLPPETQMAPMFGIYVDNEREAISPHIYMTGNLYEVKPFVGSYDASRGVRIGKTNGESLYSYSSTVSGFKFDGQGRKITAVNRADGNRLLIVSRYDDTPKIFMLNSRN